MNSTAIDVFILTAAGGIIILTTIFSIAGIQLIKMLKKARKITRNLEMIQLFLRNLLPKL